MPKESRNKGDVLNNILQLLKTTKPTKKSNKIRWFCPFKEEHHGMNPRFDNEETLVRHINASHNNHASAKAVKRLIRATSDAKKLGVI